MAASAPIERNNDLFVAEVKNPSKFFKNIAIKEVARRGTSCGCSLLHVRHNISHYLIVAMLR